MIVVVFRAHRTDAGLGDEYAEALKRMEAFAAKCRATSRTRRMSLRTASG